MCVPQFQEPDLAKKRRKNTLWCPYCGDWKKFKMGRHMASVGVTSAYKRCEACGISNEDFYVKTANKLWEVSLKPSNMKRG